MCSAPILFYISLASISTIRYLRPKTKAARAKTTRAKAAMAKVMRAKAVRAETAMF